MRFTAALLLLFSAARALGADPAPTTKRPDGPSPPRPVRVALKNVQMTDGKEQPEHWTDQYTSSGKIALHRDLQTWHSAPAALRLETVGGAAEGQVAQFFTAQPGDTLRLTGHLCAAGGATALLGVMCYDDKWRGIDFKAVGNAPPGFGWRKAEGQVTLPAGTAHAAVACLIRGDGQVWLDDVSLDGKDWGEGAQPKAARAAAKPAGPRKPTHSCDPAEGFYPEYPHAWRQVLEGQLQRAKQGPAAVVFLGDSLVQGWSEQPQWKDRYAKLGAVNLGVGGDGTPQLLYRIEKGVLDGLDPKVVVLSAGVNNVWPGFDADDTVKGLRAVVAAVGRRAPQARLALVSNFHFFDTGDGGSRRRVDTINAALRRLADGRRVRFVDVAGRFLQPNGELDPRLYAGDKLHLSADGYRVWAAALDPVLDELLK